MGLSPSPMHSPLSVYLFCPSSGSISFLFPLFLLLPLSSLPLSSFLFLQALPLPSVLISRPQDPPARLGLISFLCRDVWSTRTFRENLCAYLGCTGRVRGNVAGRAGWKGVCVHSFIHSFTVLQIVIEHLLCAKHWLGPLGFSADQDRHGPVLGS